MNVRKELFKEIYVIEFLDYDLPSDCNIRTACDKYFPYYVMAQGYLEDRGYYRNTECYVKEGLEDFHKAYIYRKEPISSEVTVETETVITELDFDDIDDEELLNINLDEFKIDD
ncbi:hypothetical protein [Lysinibacillus sphaericus]|uniref:hypothetical protein n=1 Tax=Lysinibacillus sphaericus TaxID=1421 RepID=UPI003D05F28A